MQNIETESTVHSVFKETIPAPGVGNKDSSITVSKYETSDNMRELAADLYEILRSGECVVPCTHNDDGCIDGRFTSEIKFPAEGSFETVSVDDNKDNERAKVAGGGYVTALAMLQALGENGSSPEADIAYLADMFAQNGMYCGGHVGSHGHAHEGKTDCGANDKEDQIIANGTQAPEVVAAVTAALMERSSDSYDDQAMQRGLDGWVETVGDTTYFVDSNGVTRLDAIENGILTAQDTVVSNDKASVIKNLGADHNEIRVAVMYRQGETFSQTKLRRLLIERHPDVDPKDLPQVFVVDFWRIQQLARVVAELPNRENGQSPAAEEVQDRYERALHAGVAFQVATYATLTDGSLPVDIFA